MISYMHVAETIHVFEAYVGKRGLDIPPWCIILSKGSLVTDS